MATKAAPKKPATKTPKAPRPEAPSDPAQDEVQDSRQGSAPTGDWAAQLSAARAKPIEITDGDLQESPESSEKPRAQPAAQLDAAGSSAAGAGPEAGADARGIVAMPASFAVGPQRKRHETPGITAVNDGLSLPEQYLLVAMQEGWDDRMERARPGAQGAALVGALLLDLALRGGLKVQRDRFVVDPAGVADADLAHVAAQLNELGKVSTLEAMDRLARRLPARLRPWKARLAARGYLGETTRRHLLFMKRHDTRLRDAEAQGALVKRMLRLLAGGGNPDAQTVLLLGLCDAAGLLENLVPSSTLKFNRKRIHALTAGRDTMGYAVDSQLRDVQELAVQSILKGVRTLQGTGAGR